MLSGKELFSIRTDGDAAPTQAHINWRSPLTDRNFALGFSLLSCDSGWQEDSIVLEEINEKD